MPRLCRLAFWYCLLAALVPVTLLAGAVSKPLPKLDVPGVREEHVMIPMRDGVKLSAYLYFPESASQEKLPALFEQRYAEITGLGTRKAAASLAAQGFVVAMVNYRGTHESEGVWVSYRATQWGKERDGWDVCEWLATQPWSTGKIGTFGSSQGGYVQNYLAVTQPPHLVAQYMVDTGLSLFHEGYRLGGATRPERYKAMGKVASNYADHEALLKTWDRHPDYDGYWRAEDCKPYFGKMNVPCFTIGSWYDFMNQGSIMSFQGRQKLGGPKSRDNQWLLLGPWLHGRLNKGSKVGELTYPENATWPELEHMTRWFNYWLKGEANGIEKEPKARWYVMGATGENGSPGNTWSEAADWPPALKEKRLFLNADGLLGMRRSNAVGSRTSYASDPRKPMNIPGTSFPGAKDASAFEQQAEVRTWTTEPLTEPMEWTGEVKAELYISSTAPDTDFIVRVSDVYPDGRSMLLMDYPMRARYRDGFDKQRLLTPTNAEALATRNDPRTDEIAKLSMHVGWTSIIFNKGHRIRITIASTGAPLYEPNNQTGGRQTMDWMKDTQTAINTIWHDRARPSCLRVPLRVVGK
ncbi:CocE/NonD family hydrolase [Roseimicrobium sp. ORNL1]|uniref:CocE/NonD family hydrolase n=1 Tax=Roseimicrobium sp. ORNL1 TaxID=2711231 RepID=UPI001F0D3E9D|nr:CocE/NonD family hydrolase [Roseimicrobium sp. ORNL1]